ncbi:hypothetical protein DY000_02033437 [Brassica cretica]|uniref:Uncharacterized protein n=1 Tax=Brassica cretica TaxID=69181 RepID=A0ABQ7DQU3_BRACR|nr:hypothetical protein DY000_02033437 [Brassica cretica]
MTKSPSKMASEEDESWAPLGRQCCGPVLHMKLRALLLPKRSASGSFLCKCHELHETEALSSLEAVLKAFWDNLWNQLQYFTGFNCYLPLSRVKKILKTDPKVRTILRCDVFHAVKNSETHCFLIDLVPFGPYCAMHHSIRNKSFASLTIQGVLEHAEPEKVLPPAKMILPDMNVANDMNQIKQENRIDKPFSDHKGFDLNSISREFP